MKIGAEYLKNDVCEFRVWAPFASSMLVVIYPPEMKIYPMRKQKFGYWSVIVDRIRPGMQYRYRIDDQDEYFADPASNSQPEGVFGASEIVDHNRFIWHDKNFRPVKMQNLIIYEMHIGTFTEAGTFEAAIERLDDLRELGVTAVEIMPVSQFSGDRNWGYDGVYPFAPQNTYGGPDGLKKFVDAAHMKDLTVILDVVYNHFGPEGNYISQFGRYFTHKYKTPWGDAINYDDEYSDEVRNYFVENAKYWLRNYHIDAIRLDAVHSIYDLSAKHILQEISEHVKMLETELGKDLLIIAESDLNDSRIIAHTHGGGYGCDAQWCDDFHHAIHSLLTSEKSGYYQDFGKTEHMIRALRDSYVYSGNYSKFRKRRHGNSALDFPGYRFVVFTQNHDQIGNRAFGERLSRLVNFEALKLAAGVLILSPYIPLIFMGEEYREDSPFLYFVSHTDQQLIASIQNGRRSEFSSFEWQDDIPDPQHVDTFQLSKLNWSKRTSGKHRIMLDYYKLLIELRRELPAMKNYDRDSWQVTMAGEEGVIVMNRVCKYNRTMSIMNFNNYSISVYLDFEKGQWHRLLDSSDVNWAGAGSLAPEIMEEGRQEITIREYSIILYEKLEMNHE